jgi:molybdopterin-biosynthesis enzyme MoeA-like protein
LREFALKEYNRHEVNDEAKRMAILPEGCKILKTATWVPLAVVHNVYVLPGIPSMVRDMLTFNEEHFVGVTIHRAIVRGSIRSRFPYSSSLCNSPLVFTLLPDR